MTLWSVCSLPVPSDHGISQARILEWVAIFYSRRSSQPRDRPCVSCSAGGLFTTEPTGRTDFPYTTPQIRLCVPACLVASVCPTLCDPMANMHNLPHYQDPPLGWCICYKWWTYIHTSLLTKICSVYHNSFLVLYTLRVWINIWWHVSIIITSYKVGSVP